MVRVLHANTYSHYAHTCTDTNVHPFPPAEEIRWFASNTCAKRSFYFQCQRERVSGVWEKNFSLHSLWRESRYSIWLIYESASESRVASLISGFFDETVCECVSESNAPTLRCMCMMADIQGIIPSDELTSWCQCPCPEKTHPWQDSSPWAFFSQQSWGGQRKSLVFDAVGTGQRAKKETKREGRKSSKGTSFNYLSIYY